MLEKIGFGFLIIPNPFDLFYIDSLELKSSPAPQYLDSLS
jgi:hypothetical protein